MSVIQILIVLIIAIILLAIGIVKKNKWVKIISIIPFLIVLWQIILLLGFLFH
jgi:hypothetical protein